MSNLDLFNAAEELGCVKYYDEWSIPALWSDDGGLCERRTFSIRADELQELRVEDGERVLGWGDRDGDTYLVCDRWSIRRDVLQSVFDAEKLNLQPKA